MTASDLAYSILPPLLPPNFPPTGPALSHLAAVVPLLPILLILLLLVLRALCRAIAYPFPTRWTDRLRPAIDLLPDLGRVVRALTWAGLFASLLCLLALPAASDPWGLRPLPPDALPLALDEGRWLVALGIAVAAVCAAASAGEAAHRTTKLKSARNTALSRLPPAPVTFYPPLLFATSLALTAVASRDPLLTLVALDALALTLAFALAFTSPPDLPAARGSLLASLRLFLTSSLLASLLSHLGLALSPTSRLGPPLLTLGLLLRAAALPLHPGLLALHARAATPTAMLATGLLLPASLLALTTLIPLHANLETRNPNFETQTTLSQPVPPTSNLLSRNPQSAIRNPQSPPPPHPTSDIPHPTSAVLLATIAAAIAWTLSIRQTDLRRAVSYWTVAGSTTVVGYLALASPALPPLALHLLTLGLATSATTATYVVGLIESDLGHREIPRLSGHAARSPGAFNWMLLSLFFLAATPPSAGFAGYLLSATASASHLPPPSLTPLLLLTFASTLLPLAAGLLTLHRVFLGLPRHDLTPTELTGRQRLVLLLLTTTTLTGTLAPATLLRPTPPPPIAS